MKFLAVIVLLVGVNAFEYEPIILNGKEFFPPPPAPNARVETQNSGYTTDGIELYQGDMILTEEQKEWLESPAGMRKAIDDQRYRWQNGVVQFRLSPSSVNDRQAILRGMQHWTQNSCITFQEVAANYQAPHLIFEKLNGCYSNVGRSFFQNGQTISIGPGCEGMGTVAHEIGHALGFHHEQSRPDRDNYVVILNQNLNQTMKHNFDLEVNAKDYGVQYDMGSVMHYGPDGFSTNSKNTMVTKDPFKHFMIGQREKLSFADLKLAHIMYNCASRCGANRCSNNGYMDQSCQCKCPPGFSGDRCQTGGQVPTGLTCGGAINSPTTISTPNHPGNYGQNTKCVWVVKAPSGRRVRASFQSFQAAPRWEGKNWCIWDHLEVRSNDLYDGERYCGEELNRYAVTSQRETMVLIFNAQTNYFTGFKADITFV